MKAIPRPAMPPAFAAVVEGARMLARDASWSELLAENIYWASMEGFLQSSLLGSLNRTSIEFVSDRERIVIPKRGDERALKPDLLVMPRTPAVHEAWWDARTVRGPLAQSTYRSLAALFVQLKVAWTPGNASDSATLTNKVEAVRDDVARLRTLVPSTPSAVGVLVSGFHGRSEGGRVVRESLTTIRAPVATVIDLEVEIPLLVDFRPTRWDTFLELDRAAFSTLWLAQLTPPVVAA